MQPLSVEMLTEDILQYVFKMTSLCIYTCLKTLSPFVTHLINNCLLYARQGLSQMPFQMLFQIF